MARDLIPPSSPAGRPAPDGTPNLIELPPEPPRSPSEPPMREPVGPSQFRNRFGFLLGALAGVFIAAVLVGVVVLSTGREQAAHRRGEPGAELVEVAADGPHARRRGRDRREGLGRVPRRERQAARDGHGRARSRTGVVAARASGITDLVERARRALRDGRPGPAASRSRARAARSASQLVQREALELALYTFRYLPEVEQVVTKLPPPPPTEEQKRAEAKAQSPTGSWPRSRSPRRRRAATRRTSSRRRRRSRRPTSTRSTPFPARSRRAIFYRPGDLKQQLQTPLSATLAGPGGQARQRSARPSWTRSTR